MTDRQAGQLQQANLLWQLKDYAACQKVIDSIPTDAFVRAEVDLLRGRLAMREARQLKKQFGAEATAAEREQVQKHYQEAIKILRQAQDDPLGEVAIRQSMYLIGLCLLEMGDSERRPGPVASGRGASIRKRKRGWRPACKKPICCSACTATKTRWPSIGMVLGGIHEKRAFANRWISPKKFRARILKAYQYLPRSRQIRRSGAAGRADVAAVPASAKRAAGGRNLSHLGPGRSPHSRKPCPNPRPAKPAAADASCIAPRARTSNTWPRSNSPSANIPTTSGKGPNAIWPATSSPPPCRCWKNI